MRRLRDGFVALGLTGVLILRYLAVLMALPAAVILVVWLGGEGLLLVLIVWLSVYAYRNRATV